MNKNLITYAFVAAALIAVGALAYFTMGGGGGGAGLLAGGGGADVEIKDSDRVHGSPDAPVTMIEYASMTCSHCAAFQVQVLPDLKRDYIDTGKVKLVLREFPLDAGARMASSLARCLEGEAYFNFIDLLFRNQQTWWIDLFSNNQQVTQQTVEESLANMARIAGLGRDQAIACANNPDNLAIVDANWQEGQSRYGVNSTPTFVIGGEVYRGEISYDALKAAIDPLAGG